MNPNYLPRVEQLHNIRDVEAFVLHCMGKGGMTLTVMHEDDHQELFCAGLVELYKMSDKFIPQDDGRGRSSFYGYAMMFLPRKLSSAWHAMNPTHVLVREDGGRKWRYYSPAESLDQERVFSLHDHHSLTTARHPGDFIPPPVSIPA